MIINKVYKLIMFITHIKFYFPIFLFLFPVAAYSAQDIVNVPVPTGPHEVTSQLCGACHIEIYQEWKGSMHANSTALKDPIHGAFYRNVIGDPTEEGVTKKGKYPMCLKCHAPNAALKRKTKLDAQPAFNEGVNCIFCHTITGFKGVVKDDGKLRLGADAYEISNTSLQAPSGKNYSTGPMPEKTTSITKPFHPFPMEGGNAPLFKSNAVCMGCHDQRKNFHGIPLCATGDEIATSKSSTTCQSCHMPMTKVDGHTNHSMMGGHSPAMVSRAISMDLDVQKKEDTYNATIKIINKLPHKFPTGAPFRTVILRMTAFDDAGNELWKNYRTHPMKDDPQAAFVYTLGDGEGNVAMPPKAKEVISDNRMEPHSERVLQYQIPASNVKVIQAEVVYTLLWPNLMNKLDGVLPDKMKAPRRAAFAEVRL